MNRCFNIIFNNILFVYFTLHSFTTFTAGLKDWNYFDDWDLNLTANCLNWVHELNRTDKSEPLPARRFKTYLWSNI